VNPVDGAHRARDFFYLFLDIYSPLAYVNHSKLVSVLKVITKVRPVYDPVYAILCVGNFTERNPRVSIFEFPTGI
jgi:hypothetical protein